MPCGLQDWEIAKLMKQDMKELRDEIEKLTRLLCEAMKHLEKPYLTFAINYSAELNEWWNAHKIVDAERIQEISQAQLDASAMETLKVYQEIKDDLTKYIDQVFLNAAKGLK